MKYSKNLSLCLYANCKNYTNYVKHSYCKKHLSKNIAIDNNYKQILSETSSPEIFISDIDETKEKNYNKNENINIVKRELFSINNYISFSKEINKC